MVWTLGETGARFFLNHLLELLTLASRLCLYLAAKGFEEDWIIGLIIGDAESIWVENIVNFSGCSL